MVSNKKCAKSCLEIFFSPFASIILRNVTSWAIYFVLIVYRSFSATHSCQNNKGQAENDMHTTINKKGMSVPDTNER